jgi:DNA repair exonuclease SbcCD ATPase subunit
MKLNRIILDNFITYEHLDYKFEDKPLLVQGLNLTDENQKSNGAGKSGIATGIEFCITASNSRDVRDLELVSYGQSEARTQLYASCDIRKESIHIDWAIKVKGSNKLTLSIKSYDDEWEEVSFSNVNDGKKYILAWFAISKEDLFNYYIINKSRFKSFFKSSNKEKVDLINRFSDASIISGLENINNDNLEDEARFKQSELDKNAGKVEMIKDQIESEKNRDFKEELADQIEDFDMDIKTAKEDIIELNGDIEKEKGELVIIEDEIEVEIRLYSAINNDLDDANRELKDFSATDYGPKIEKLESKLDGIEAGADEVENEQTEWEIKSTKVKELISKINIKLVGQITCPSCKHDFVLDGDIDELKKNKISASDMISKIDDKIGDCKSKLKDCEDKIESIETKLSKIEESQDKDKQEKRSLLADIDAILVKSRNSKSNLANLERGKERFRVNLFDIEQDIKKCNETIKENEAKISDLKLGNNKSLITTLENDLGSLEVTRTQYQIELETINDEIYLRNQWKNNFKQFRGFLANQSLEVIQFHCNRYLHDMGSDLTIVMEGYKMLANGSVKDEITSKVLRSGVDRSFSSFSGGEQGRLLFASILANRHMINKTHPYGGLDFLSVDEIFEGVDGIGLKHLIKSASNLNITAMIITHVTDENASSDVLTIVKENGVSTIKQN